jgi:drug/metabolite transporter (DMT)-like permease
MNAQRFAVWLMIAQGFLFAAETAAIHQIGANLSVMQLALLRGTGGVMLALLLARHLGRAVVRTRQLGLQLLRGAVSLLYLWVMMYSFVHMPFADATAISYTQAAYIAVFSVLILHETVGGNHWLAAAVGIAGAVLIAKPALVGWNCVYLIALLGTGLNGLAFVLNRYLQREDSEATTMFYTNAVAVLGNAPALLMAGLPAPDALAWLPGVLILGPIGMYAGIIAVRHASASALGPYTLLRLVIGLVGGVVVFREPPDSYSISGGVLILGSCALATRQASFGVGLVWNWLWRRLPPRSALFGTAR